MNRIVAISYAVVLATTTSCKTPRQTGDSATKDVLRQGPYGPSEIIYVTRNSGIKFHYRKCVDDTTPSRNCPNGTEATPIAAQDYLAAVPDEIFDRFDPNFREGGADVILDERRNSNDWIALTAPFGGGTSPVGMNFAKVSQGSFLMGSPSSESGRFSDEVQHLVTITYDFFVQTTEVTQEQWFKVMGDNPSRFKAEQDCPGEYKQVSGVGLCPNNPVEQIDWHDIRLFLAKMNEKRDGFRYRLPTESEWEYAARGGSTGPYSVAGDLADFAWFSDNAGNRTHAVAKLKPNAYGLYDVHGNVQEWTSDWYGDYPNSNVTDPVGASSGSQRVLRGGSWSYTWDSCRSANRDHRTPNHSRPFVGFRLLRMPFS